MITNGYAEEFDDDNFAGDVSAVSSDDGRDIAKSLTNSPRPGRISRESDDSMINRVTFIDEIGVCSNCETDDGSPNLRQKKRKRKHRKSFENSEQSPDVYNISRKSFARSSRKGLIPNKDLDVSLSPDLRKKSLKKLPDHAFEALPRQRSFKRSSSQRGSRISRHDPTEIYQQREQCRLQRHSSASGSHTNSSLVIDRQNSIRSNLDTTPRRKSSVRSARLRSDSRNNSNFSEHLDLRNGNLSPKERRRQKVVLIVIVFFIFFLLASVILVIVTLTNSTFNSNSSERMSLTENQSDLVRKENEQLMNSFGDDDHLYNVTQATSSTSLEATARTNISN